LCVGPDYLTFNKNRKRITSTGKVKKLTGCSGDALTLLEFLENENVIKIDDNFSKTNAFTSKNNGSNVIIIEKLKEYEFE
jgi:hypothetical protein